MGWVDRVGVQFSLSISYFVDLTLKLWKSLHHYKTKQKN